MIKFAAIIAYWIWAIRLLRQESPKRRERNFFFVAGMLLLVFVSLSGCVTYKHDFKTDRHQVCTHFVCNQE